MKSEEEEFQVKLRKNPQKQDEELKQKQELKPISRPNNTLFWNWLESNKIVEFETDDFVSAYPQVTRKIADKIMVQQLQQGNLQQMGKERFIVRDKGNKEKLKNERQTQDANK